jgi:hypothetical protein
MDQDSTAPSREQLQKLFKNLPRMVVTQNNKIAPRHADKATLARQFCPVCGKLHDFVYRHKDDEVVPGNCLECQKQFDDGCFAAVCEMPDGEKKLVFLKPTNNRAADLVGKIVPVTVPVMQKILEQMKAKNGL